MFKDATKEIRRNTSILNCVKMLLFNLLCKKCLQHGIQLPDEDDLILCIYCGASHSFNVIEKSDYDKCEKITKYNKMKRYNKKV